MKTIINRKLYDTATAKDLASNIHDNDYKMEKLYRKKNGEYFLYLNVYSISRFNPLTTDEAMAWAEKNMDADSYIQEFGSVEE